MLKKINFDCKKILKTFFFEHGSLTLFAMRNTQSFFKKKRISKIFKIPKPRLEFTIHKMIGIQFT